VFYNFAAKNKMRKIVDYVIIASSTGIENLEKLIKQNIDLDWQPLGGVTTMNVKSATDNSENKESLIQAMVRYDD
jgi:hypothetical protein